MKKIISMLLVIAMVITVLTVGVATTGAVETATITIYGLDGSTQVKEIAVGEEFTVYTTLDVSASVSNGMVGAVQGTQTYSSDVLQLVDEVSSKYGDIVDLMQVFPVTGTSTIANGAQTGKIVYNAGTSSVTNGFLFNTSYSKLIVTTYKVTKAGAGEVKNALRNLAAADANLTRIVFQGELQSGKSIAGKAYFEDPRPAIDHAEITVYSLDGRKVTKNFKIGDTFTVYTTLDVTSSIANGMISSIQGTQKYTKSVLNLVDSVDASGMITDTAKVFPTTKSSTQAVATVDGTIKYSVATANGFAFNSATSQLITTTYKVTANGYADITNRLIVLAAADEDVTRIVFAGELQPGMSYSMPATFDLGEFPTEPVEPTIPTPTQEPTKPATKLKVTLINPDNTTEVKEFNVGDTFTVYTTLDVTSCIADGNIATINGTQTYPFDKLQLHAKLEGEYNEITDKDDMFPVMGSDSTAASAQNGVITFTASRAALNNGMKFDGSKLIVTTYTVTATGEATIATTFRELIASDRALTKIVYRGETLPGMSYSLNGSFTDSSVPETKANVTIYGIDGTSVTKTFNVGETFTVYTTFNASQAAAKGMLAAVSAKQTFTGSILKSADKVDALSLVTDTEGMFPILGKGATARITDGLIQYNAATPQIGNGFRFDSDNAVLIKTTYTVIAAGDAEVRNALVTVAAADADLSRIVDNGKVVGGAKLGGIASFTEPDGETYLLGDANNDDDIDSIDVTYIQRYNANLTLSVDREIVHRNGDVDGSGDLEIIDATYIQRHLARLSTGYPIGEYMPVK